MLPGSGLFFSSYWKNSTSLPGKFLAVVLIGQIVLSVSMVSQGLEVKPLLQYLLFLCSVQIYMNNHNFDGLHLDCEILYCPYLYTDYMGPWELHF